MICGFDPGCHLAAWWTEIVSGLPWWAPWAFYGSLALLVAGVAWTIIKFGHRIGGRLGGAGAAGLVATVVGVILTIFAPRRAAVRKAEPVDPKPAPRVPPKTLIERLRGGK